MLHEKGRTWNGAAVWLQLSSSQQQNVWSEKRLTINALTCYHQWLLLGDGRIVICHIPCYYKWGVLVGIQGPLFCLEMTFQMGLDRNSMPLWWVWPALKWETLPPASKSLVSGTDINWLLLFSTLLVVTLWNTEVRRILKSAEQKAWLISDAYLGQERKWQQEMLYLPSGLDDSHLKSNLGFEHEFLNLKKSPWFSWICSQRVGIKWNHL